MGFLSLLWYSTLLVALSLKSFWQIYLSSERGAPVSSCGLAKKVACCLLSPDGREFKKDVKRLTVPCLVGVFNEESKIIIQLFLVQCDCGVRVPNNCWVLVSKVWSSWFKHEHWWESFSFLPWYFVCCYSIARSLAHNCLAKQTLHLVRYNATFLLL